MSAVPVLLIAGLMGSFRARRSSDDRLTVAGGSLNAGGKNAVAPRLAAVFRTDNVVERLTDRRVLRVGRGQVGPVRLHARGSVDEVGAVGRADGVVEQRPGRAARATGGCPGEGRGG